MRTGPFLIVGLGNPGQRYARTRHNFGFLLLDELVSKHSGALTKVKLSSGECYELSYPNFGLGSEESWLVGGSRVLLLKPTTFMNLSGEAVRELSRKYALVPERICVVHDELDLPFGVARLKVGGGLAGHNGLKSISSVLGSRDFFRIRLGIGRPSGPEEVSDYVLRGFDELERAELPTVLVKGVELLESFCEKGFAKAQAKFH